MFGLDLISILAAAVGGGIGGALGGALALLFSDQRVRVGVIVAFAAVGAALANPLIKPFLETSVGAPIRAEQFDATYDREVVPQIQKIPALVRIFRDHPDVEAKFRAKVREVYQTGGAQAVVEQSSVIGALVLADAFISYMPRARGQDLILFAATMSEIFSALNAKDPEACIFYQFGANYGKPVSPDRLLAAIGQDGQKKQLDVLNAIVLNAGDQPIAFDDTKATLAVAALSQRHVPLLTGKSGEVAQGQRPPTDVAEAKIACSFAVALFNDLATMDPATAELILRKMFARQG